MHVLNTVGKTKAQNRKSLWIDLYPYLLFQKMNVVCGEWEIHVRYAVRVKLYEGPKKYALSGVKKNNNSHIFLGKNF